MGWIKVEDGKTSKLRVAMAGREDPKLVMVVFIFYLILNITLMINSVKY